MDVKQKIREAQGKIIDNLISCEALICELYETYSRHDADLQPFWHDLALEEKGHAEHLRKLHRLLEKGVIFTNIGRFDQSLISPIIATVKHELEVAHESPPDRLHTLQTALKLEVTLVDSHFYDVVKADAPEFTVVARELYSATQKHIALVRDKFIAEQNQTPRLPPTREEH